MSKHDMNTNEALAFLGISIRTLNRYIKEGKIVPKKKKDHKNYFRKSDLLLIATETEGNKQYSSTKNKKVIEPEVVAADALTVTGDPAMNIYHAIREELFPDGCSDSEASVLNDLAVIRLHSNHLSNALVQNPMDEYTQKMLDRSLSMESRLIQRIKNASI